MTKPERAIGFRLHELAGSIPPDHRLIVTQPGGKRRIKLHQIWVDRLTDELWEIVRFPSLGASRDALRYVLTRYGGYWSQEWVLTSAELATDFQVLEEAIESRRTRLVDLRLRYESSEIDTMDFPDFKSFICSFGLDPETGFRID